MMNRSRRTALIAFAVFGCAIPPVLADRVVDEPRMICSIVEVNFCAPGGPCVQGPPWMWNVPDFIEIDLTGQELRTPEASGRNRRTPIRGAIRENGELVLTGVEEGKSFVFSIREDTGGLTVTLAAWAAGGVAFGTCTPLR